MPTTPIPHSSFPIPASWLFALALTTLPATATAQTDSTWRDHNRAADAAIARTDWADARRHMQQMDRLLGGHPGVAAALARNALRLGDTAEALAQLGRIGAMGVVTRAAGDTAFDALRGLPAFQAAAAAIAANAATIGSATLLATVPDSAAIVEDLAWDAPRRRFLVTDVRGGRMHALAPDGSIRPWGDTLPDGWGYLGIGIDAQRGTAWVTAVTIPQAAGYRAALEGHAAILRLDAATGAVQRRFDLPVPTRSAPGDIGIAENGDVFVGDGQGGVVFVIRGGGDVLDTLVAPGRFRGTQQPAIAPDGRSIFVADYGRGIARIDRTSGALTWLEHGPGVTLTGIDGLLMYGRDLIAVQNGVNPNRVVRLTLDAAQAAVTGAQILLRSPAADEPTHVAVVGPYLYLIGNAGWNKYGEDGAPAAGVPMLPARLMRMDLPAR